MERFFQRWLLGIWARLLVTVILIVTLVWAVLGVAIIFFSQVKSDYTALADEHIPRIALASELAENSAKIAHLTATVVTRPNDISDSELNAALEDVIGSISTRIGMVDPGVAGTDLEPARLNAKLGELLQDILREFGRRQELVNLITDSISNLRWLNVDIQDEVDPLLNDYAFNIDVAMESLTVSSDPDFRRRLSERIVLERSARGQVERIGAEAATLVTLTIQSSVATNLQQLEQFHALSLDALSRLSVVAGRLPVEPQFLTLRQSVAALGPLATGEKAPNQIRRNWIDTQSRLVVLLGEVQDQLAVLQSTLASTGTEQRDIVEAVTDRSARRSQVAIWWLIGLTCLTGGIGAAALFGYIRPGIVKPLGLLSSALSAIASGTPPGRIPEPGNDEIGRMSEAVHEFRRSVEARDTAFSQLSTEVAERRRAVENLSQTQAELVQAGKLAALGQLSAGISHELNQPLAAMKYRIGLLRSGHEKGADEKVRKQIERIEGLLLRMAATITHLRRFARSSTYRSDSLALGPLIDGSLLLLKNRVEESSFALTVSKDAPDTRVRGDQILIEQVILNLLSNAFDAIAETKTGYGTIALSTHINGSEVSLLVEDNGVGLGALRPEEAFDPFVTTKEVGEGLGLGLSISYNIVKGMGGDLRLEPNSSVGTRAILTLPIGDQDDK